MVRTATGNDPIKFMPDARHEEDNGWQMRCEDVKTRIGVLFNCYTMSDVIFQVETTCIPAHKFVLGSASPIFYKQLYEASCDLDLQRVFRQASIVSEGGLSGLSSMDRPVHDHQRVMNIEDVPHLAFFEFLQFIYTDSVNITLDNVLNLIFLADQYKVAGLSEHCFDFVRAEIVPHSVLRVLKILRELLLKAIVSMWRECVESKKALAEFRQMNRAQRRAKNKEFDDTESCMSVDTMQTSRSNPESHNNSRMSRTVGRRSSSYKDLDEDAETVFSGAEDSDGGDARGGFSKKEMNFSSGFKGTMLKIKISNFAEDLSGRCWRCIQEDTGAVVSSPDFWEQDVSMLRKILRLDTCSISEIALFRACNEWADQQCKKTGLASTAERKREILGEESLHLIRFPTMRLEEFQWEVVPTGMLVYEDVQSLLNSMTSRGSAFGTAYNDKPRSNKTLKGEKNRALDDVVTDLTPTSPIYSAVHNDPLDSMLAAELLGSHLKQTVEDQTPANDPNGASPAPTSFATGVGYSSLSPRTASLSASRSRLPPITPRSMGASGGGVGRGEPVPPTSARGPRSPKKVVAEMVMGKHMDTEESEDGIVMQGGGRRPVPDDFHRLAPGLYRFREDSLIEVWLKDGEAMVTNHGQNPAITYGSVHYAFHTAPVDVATARARVGIPVGTAQAKGGVPLASFLCRQ